MCQPRTKTKAIVAALALSLTVAGCATNAETGTAIGVITGGVIGNQFGKGSGRILATAAGMFIGGIVGHSIGRRLDEHDRLMAQRAELAALERDEVGEPITWRSERSGHYGEVYAEPAYEYEGRRCRAYRHIVVIDGQRETLRGRACRRPDGTWRAVG